MSSRGSIYGQLQLFAVIANQGSIRGAARELGLSAPSVSMALKQLEADVGLPLFLRTTRSMELTDAGRLLLKRTESPIAELKLAVESVQELVAIPAGRLAVTVPRFVYRWLLKDKIAAFCRRYPMIDLELSLDDAAVDLISGGFDAGIRLGHRISEDMVARQITAPSRDALFAAPEYLASAGVPQRPEDLKNHPFIYYRFIKSRQLSRANLIVRGREVDYDLPTSMIVNDTQVLLDMSCEGLGIGKLLEPLAQPYFDSGQLQPILQSYWPKLPGLYVYFVQRSQQARRLRVFVDFLVEECQDAVGSR